MSLKHQPEETINSRYWVIDVLGQGSSGITYGVEDIKTQTKVALKALSLRRLKDWKQIELFEREAEILAKLNHPAIPQYLDYFQVDTPDNRAFYLAQTLAPGKPLSTWVESGWRTREKDVKNIAQQILSVLNYLHSLDPPVIHRDIKPQNIIRSKDGKIYLVDFGAVKNTYHNTLMQGSTVVGTYGYMAPEQFRGKAVPATDLYSLGATLLYLLTHRSPAELPQDTLKLDFRTLVNISEEFFDWLDKILEPSLEYRYSSAKEALAALDSQQKKGIRNSQKNKLKKRSKTKEGVLTVFVVLIHASPFLLMLLVTASIYFDALIELPSYSPHWRVLSKFGYHPLNVCHSYPGMNHYVRSGGKSNITVATRSRNLKQLSECTLTGKNHLNLYHQAIFNQAARTNDVEAVRAVIDEAVDINFQTKPRDFTALHWAIYNHNSKMVMLLTEQEADVNIIASHPYSSTVLDQGYPLDVSAISLAFEQNNHSIIKYLIDDIERVDIDRTFLSKVRRAIWLNDLELIRLISSNEMLVKALRENIFYDARSKKNISILDLAKKYEKEEMIDLVDQNFPK